MPGTAPERFFFIHVMKTAGGTFGWHLRANFARDELYPDRATDKDLYRASTSVDYLLQIDEARRARLRAYTGHFPWCATGQMGLELVTMTLLREPIARVVSHLGHARRHHLMLQGRDYEAIYSDPAFRAASLLNHQVKVFAFRESDGAPNCSAPLEVDAARLEEAKRNLSSVDVVGLQEDFGAFIDEIGERFGWRAPDVPAQHLGDGEPVPDGLLDRIRADLIADTEFYEFAKTLVSERRELRR